MVLVLANNLTMVAGPGQLAVITTDPIPLNGDDRLKAIIDIHVLFGTPAAGPGLGFAIEVSNNGQDFVPFGTPDDRNALGAQEWSNIGVAFAYFRVVFSLQADVGVIAGVTFDCHMNVDKMGG